MFFDLTKKINAVSRSISTENITGAKGQGALSTLEEGTGGFHARELGVGWKVNPFMTMKAGTVNTLAHIVGSGSIRHIWLTPTGNWRHQILRIYWDGEENPSVECPIGDFFACGLNQYSQINSIPVCVNPGSALNCYWEMPFKKECLITVENLTDTDLNIYYQIDYMLHEHDSEILYFHAHFRRVNPLPYKEVYTILDGVEGSGHYVGTYMVWGANNSGWWGEGEIKFYIDGDVNPTICGTGTEDYFCGSYNFENLKTHLYQEFSTPYTGLPFVQRTDGQYKSQQRFSLYRWHLTDPVIFESDLKVTIQALGWRADKRYLPLQDDISSVAFWYQTLPHKKFKDLPDKDSLEII